MSNMYYVNLGKITWPNVCHVKNSCCWKEISLYKQILQKCNYAVILFNIHGILRYETCQRPGAFVS